MDPTRGSVLVDGFDPYRLYHAVHCLRVALDGGDGGGQALRRYEDRPPSDETEALYRSLRGAAAE